VTAHRYWRIRLDAINSGTSVSIGELQFRVARHSRHHSQDGTAAQGGAGTASGTNPPSAAFDGSTSTQWFRTGVGVGTFISMDFGVSGRDVIEVMMQATTSSFSAGRLPKDFTIEYSDDNSSWTVAHTVTGETSWSSGEERAWLFGSPPGVSDPQLSQLVAYAVASQPAAQTRASQLAMLVASAAETSSGQFKTKVHQVVAYALVRGKAERVDLRAWTFLQDDHLFYGLQLGAGGTIVHDMLTRQWSQWSSPGFDYFRLEDVTDWEGYNLGCDTENGTIWQIDPTGRLDDGDTPITSQVTGQATVRFRRAVPCFMAELACSQAEPATEDGTSIRLRTSDDAAQSWLDHGTVAGEALGTATLFRWYGLGLMQAPGRVFEITNIGYARRLDGFDVEAGQ
jgi:hypothetical protein